MTIEQLFGTLQQSIVDIWRAHLKTDKHSIHVVLDDYYKEMPELIDDLIENYMGRYGKVLSYENVLNPESFTDPAEYLSALREMVSQTYDTISASELKSDLDAILSKIDSTIYKLKELTESGEEVEFTLETGAGQCIKALEESVSTGMRLKRNIRYEEEEENCSKKKCKGSKCDHEEECNVKESYVSLADYILSKSI